MKKATGIITGIAVVGLAIGSTAFAMTEKGNKLILKALDGSPTQTEKTIATTQKKIVETTSQDPENSGVVIFDPKTGKVVATGKPNEGGDGDTTQTAVKNFLSHYLNVKTSQSENFKEMISRLSKINTKYSTIVKLKNAKMLKSIGGNLKQAYALVNDEEKAKIEKIAAFYEKTYGIKINVNPKTETVENDDDDLSLDGLLVSNLDDDLAEAKARLAKSILAKNKTREGLIETARKYVATGGNPADLPGWEEAAEEFGITPDDL